MKLLIPLFLLIGFAEITSAQTSDLQNFTRFANDEFTVHNQFIEVDVFQDAETRLVLRNDSLKTEVVWIDSVYVSSQSIILTFEKSLERAKQIYAEKQIVVIKNQPAGYLTFWYRKNEVEASFRFFRIP